MFMWLKLRGGWWILYGRRLSLGIWGGAVRKLLLNASFLVCGNGLFRLMFWQWSIINSNACQACEPGLGECHMRPREAVAKEGGWWVRNLLANRLWLLLGSQPFRGRLKQDEQEMNLPYNRLNRRGRGSLTSIKNHLHKKHFLSNTDRYVSCLIERISNELRILNINFEARSSKNPCAMFDYIRVMVDEDFLFAWPIKTTNYTGLFSKDYRLHSTQKGSFSALDPCFHQVLRAFAR